MRHIGPALLFALACSAAGPGTAPAAEVVAQWRFDEGGSTVAYDDGRYGLDGTLGAEGNGGPPQRISGVSGGAVRFDGQNYVTLPPAPELSPASLTLEAVVRADTSPGTYRYVVSHGADACYAASYALYTGETGGIAFYAYDGRRYVISAAAAPSAVWDGAWHHVAGTFDGQSVRLFVDGHPVGDPTPAPLSIAYQLTSRQGYIGNYHGPCALSFIGDVDLVRLWDGALDPGAVGPLADAGLSPAAAAPPAAAPATVPSAPTRRTSRAELPAAAPGSRVPVAPSARRPARARCVMLPSLRRLRPGRAVRLTVRVRLGGRNLRGVRVVASVAGVARPLARARTDRAGRARLRFRAPRRAAVRLSVTGRRTCGTALAVAAPRKTGVR